MKKQEKVVKEMFQRQSKTGTKKKTSNPTPPKTDISSQVYMLSAFYLVHLWIQNNNTLFSI